MSERPEDAREIPGYPGYWATADGRIWSDTTKRYLNSSGKTDGGYNRICIKVNGVFTTSKVHRLICLAFHGEPPADKPLTRHLDGNKTNNLPSNLAWGNAKENAEDAMKHGTWTHGIKAGRAKLDDYQVRAMRLLRAHGVSYWRIAEIFKIDRSYTRKIVLGMFWKHVTF